jgi:hypothetical protein
MATDCAAAGVIIIVGQIRRICHKRSPTQRPVDKPALSRPLPLQSVDDLIVPVANNHPRETEGIKQPEQPWLRHMVNQGFHPGLHSRYCDVNMCGLVTTLCQTSTRHAVPRQTRLAVLPSGLTEHRCLRQPLRPDQRPGTARIVPKREPESW